MISRLNSLILKELQAFLRDPQGRMLLIVPVLLQVALFPLASTLEVKNNTLAVLNEDHGSASYELIQRFSAAQAFSHVLHLRNEGEMEQIINKQDALIAIRFSPDFSRDLTAGRTAKVQAILDGRRSNAAQIAFGYIRQIVSSVARERSNARGHAAEPELIVRHWFNPNLDYVRHIIPSLVAIITTISTLVVTALSVAREREQGTFDQLLVSPLTPGMIMVGKAVPALIIATVQGTIVIAAGVIVYKIPFEGALLVLYPCMVLFILSLAGLGLLLSSICSTQQQAFLGTFSFTMPAILLSGFPSPVENMPQWMQVLDWFNPLRHFIPIVKGVFIKDVPGVALLPHVYPLLVIAVITMAAANWMFRRRIG
jgi:ABC-2 type transport system permease protein